MNSLKFKLIILLCVGGFLSANAHINPDHERRYQNNTADFRMDCAGATSQVDQAVNNVQARLRAGGDVWWDGSDEGLYIVPKVEPGADPVSSLFAGAVWIGGFDPAGNLKLAAQTYGGSDNTDFYPGPLDPDTGTTDQETCSHWDKHFHVTGAAIEAHLKEYNLLLEVYLEAFPEATQAEIDENVKVAPESISDEVNGWPARGNKEFFDIHDFELPNTSQGLGGFFDRNGNSLYEPEFGDYPIIEIRGCNDPQYPDDMYFWIYNDAGGVHGQSNADPINMEVQVQAFAYATNDQLNDMTFQRYKLINRAVESIDSTYFAMWVDPDLGCPFDDYIGCDVGRSLMYVYNEDELDGQPNCDCPQGVNPYCDEVPILGVDYFRGPLAPKLIIIDTISSLDTIVYDTSYMNPPRGIAADTIIEEGMTSFVYYTGQGAPAGGGDPSSAQEYFRYLTGTWQDGTPFTEGGTGYGGVVPTNFVFPNPPDDINGWSMYQEGLPAGDRRTVQATGPLRLDPGAVNELIIGAPWVPNVKHPGPDISRLLFADDIAQALFDNCFDITDGPDAPDLCAIELDQELIFTLTNEAISNNVNEEYQEEDLRAPSGVDNIYRFQGYKVFQLAAPDVTAAELINPDRAELVYQVDIKDGIANVHNWTSEPNPDPAAGEGDSPKNIWTPTLKVEGNNEGISHTFRVTEDRFASDDTRLVNHKKYYYLTIAYAYNNYAQFTPTTEIGQQNSYLEGRRNIRTYTVIPRPINDMELNTVYADGAVVTRTDGTGANATFLDIDYAQTDLNAMLDGTFDGDITYLPGAAPIDVKVYDPRNVQDGEFTLRFDTDLSANDAGIIRGANRWTLTKDNDPSFEVVSERSIARLNEQLIADHGFSVALGQTDDAGEKADDTNGAIGQTISYADPAGTAWFNWVPEGNGISNYLLTGNNEILFDLDPTEALSHLGNQAFAPFALAEYRTSQQVLTPGWVNTLSSTLVNDLETLNNVDIVMTADKSKWSRCIVVETASPYIYDQNLLGIGIPTEGDVNNLDLRSAPSVGKYDNDGDGIADPDGDANTGMGWFPGYAIDVETGKRLNIFFGENSTYRCDPGLGFDIFCDPSVDGGYLNDVAVGADMMWNPTSQVFLNTGGQPNFYNFHFGAQHYIYVTDTEYDGCTELRSTITNNLPILRRAAYQSIKWAGIPLLNEETELTALGGGETGLIPNDVTVKVRVDNPYAVAAEEGDNAGYPAYKFSLTGKEAVASSTQAQWDAEMDAINVVPNPYYGFSSYEISQFSNVVKITNLPAECTVTIYSLDGKFIRQYKRNEVELSKGLSNAGVLNSQINPAIEWDLKNKSGIPVASGVYLVHIDGGELGERVIKWFGVARQFDPSGL